MTDPKKKMIPDDMTADTLMSDDMVNDIMEERKRMARWFNETYGLNVIVDHESDEQKDTQ